MYVAIQNHTDNNQVDTFIEKKLNRAFLRYSDRLASANVKVENVTGGANSVLKRCCMEIQTTPRGIIRVQEEAETIHAAVARAARSVETRLRRSSERQIARSRSRHRLAKRTPSDLIGLASN
ncbi:MAG: HPF/RaiA family ribosome-associated protein [Planctomycetales bacterium]|nr:HPF/RaiA family ribosome-associated protein [Planctomycetales bacterium]